jgi:hypothetical protein
MIGPETETQEETGQSTLNGDRGLLLYWTCRHDIMLGEPVLVFFQNRSLSAIQPDDSLPVVPSETITRR